MEYVEQYLDMIWREDAFLVREEPFTLKSGLKSHLYANHRGLICDPDKLTFLGTLLAQTATEAFGPAVVFCAVDSSTSPYLVASCSLDSRLPLVNYRPVNREKGLPDITFFYRAHGVHSDHRPAVVFVDDVVTTSTTLDSAAMDLRYGGWEVAGAVCLLDRRVPTETVEDESVIIRGVATLDTVVRFGVERGLMSEDLCRHAERELAAR